MRYYYLKTDGANNIIYLADTFYEQSNCVKLSLEEYEKALLHKKFNLETREFSELKTVEKDPPSTSDLQNDNLTIMMAQAEQYEEQQQLKQNQLSIMAAIAELYEMNGGA